MDQSDWEMAQREVSSESVFPKTFFHPPNLARGGGLTQGLRSTHFSDRELKA